MNRLESAGGPALRSHLATAIALSVARRAVTDCAHCCFFLGFFLGRCLVAITA